MADLLISVSGVRGIVGDSMTPAVAAAYAGAFGAWLRSASGRDAPALCVGRDARPSGPGLAAAAMAGLNSAGCSALDLGVVATPTVSVMIGELRADGGLVVTASHNPDEYNGLKCLGPDGSAPPAPEVERIAGSFRRAVAEPAPPRSPARPPARDGRGPRVHVERVVGLADAGAIRSRGFRVVLDSCCGAGGEAGRMLLEALGARVVHIHGEPTGRCPHGLEPTRENLQELATRTAAQGADLGFAQDPDADRLAIVDEVGAYIGEEYTLALAAHQALSRRGPGPIVANLSTSRLIDDVAAAHRGASVVRTAVGEANVAAAMKECGAVLGGEGNGGVIDPRVCRVRDSLSAMALVLGLLAAERRPLSAVVADLPRYAMIKRRLELGDVGGRDGLAAAIARLPRAFPRARANTADGLRLDFEDGWVHLRPSNTEPIARLIAEARDPERAAARAGEVAAAAATASGAPRAGAPAPAGGPPAAAPRSAPRGR